MKLFLRFLFVLALCSSTTHAGAEQNMGIGGDVPPMCKVASAPTRTDSTNMRLGQADLSEATIIIDELIDPQTAQLKASSINLRFDVTCNGPHQVEIRSRDGALKPQNLPEILTERFNPQVNYIATLTWNNDTLAITADGNAASTQAGSTTAFAVAGTAELEVRVDASINDMTRPVVEGVYSDTLVITVSPQI